MHLNSLTIIRQPRVQDETGLSQSTLYEHITAGLFTPGTKIGQRALGWPLEEVQSINAARIAGYSDVQIRQLVKRLIALRR